MRMITFHLIFPLKKQPPRKLRTISHFSVLPTSLDRCRIGRPSFVFSVLLLSLSFSQRSPYLFSCPTPTCFLGSTNLCSCFQVLPALIIPSHSDSFVRRVMGGSCSVPAIAIGPGAQQETRQAGSLPGRLCPSWCL